MKITLTAKRQATFPVEVCRAMNLVPGTRLEITPGTSPDEWIIRPYRIREELLAPLKGRLPKVASHSEAGSFDVAAFRESPKDHAALRD